MNIMLSIEVRILHLILLPLNLFYIMHGNRMMQTYVFWLACVLCIYVKKL